MFAELAQTLGIVSIDKTITYLRGKEKAWSGCLSVRRGSRRATTLKIIFLYVCASVCGTCEGAHGGGKRALESRGTGVPGGCKLPNHAGD